MFRYEAAVNDLLADTYEEMFHQLQLKQEGKFKYVAGEEGADSVGILFEEVLEVYRANNDVRDFGEAEHGDHLEEELVQVAAVALQWAAQRRIARKFVPPQFPGNVAVEDANDAPAEPPTEVEPATVVERHFVGGGPGLPMSIDPQRMG